MLWLKAWHIIFVVTWFSGLFYLPRLFVYHALTTDPLGSERFKIMERKLYYGITTPSGLLATFCGAWLIKINFAAYQHQLWLHIKLGLVLIVWIYHIICGKYLRDFKHNNNGHSHIYYRFFNEAPVVLLITIVILVVIKPF